MTKQKRSLVERIATSLKIIPELEQPELPLAGEGMQKVDLQNFPPHGTMG